MAYDRASDNRVRLLPGSVSSLLGEWIARAFGWALLIGAITVWLALVSWRASDPSLTHPNGVGAHNFLGPSGAMISDLLLQTVGLTAVFLLAGPIVFGLQLVSRGSVPGAQHRLLFFCASLFLIAAGLSAIPTFAAWPLSHGYGGLLGDILFMLFASLLQPFVGSLAAGLVGLATISLGSLIFATALGLDRQTLGQAFAGQRPRARWSNPADGWPPTHHANATGHPAGHAPSPYPAHGAPPAVYPHPSYPQGGVPSSVQHSYPQHDVGGPAAAFPHAAPVAQPVSAAALFPAATSSAAHVQPPQQDAPAAAHAEDATHAADHGHHEHEFITLPRIFSKANASRPVGADAAQSTHPDDAPNAIARAMSGLTKWFEGEHAPAEPHPEPRTPIEPTLPPPPKPVGTPRPEPRRPAAYRPPGLNLLAAPKANKAAPELSQTVLRGNAGLLEDVLSDFGVKGEVKAVRPGPVITLYELEIARGIKASRVIGLADDIARSMSAPSARIAVIPGKNTLGIELPNMRRGTVAFREILQHDAYGAGQQALPLALGKAIDGTPVVTDLARMPHLLVAGTTGSGKSVGVNAMILSLLYRYGPDRLRLLMIDPKMLELSIYNGIPHLLTPVVTDPAKAVSALNWVVREMEERYKRMAELNVRNIGAFNARLEDALKRGRPMSQRVQTGFDEETGEPVYEERTCATEPLPHIVVIVDEFADLMLVAGKEIEAAIQRLAQMARAAGIHLIMATQRPSVDIVTGTIKANFPTRISFKVASKVDSRTIINEQGAEQLLGQGDMLMSDGSGSLVRVHGAFVSDEEVETVASHLRAQQRPDYVEGITDGADDAQAGSEAAGPRADDGEDLYAKAVAIVLRDRKASTSYVQRRLSIGYNRAADLIERMEADGLISPANHAGKREILAANQ